MSLPHPSLSIIVTCYNYGAYIREALANLSQIESSIPFETIIVDDGSTDPETQEVIAALQKDPQYHVIVQDNQGVCRARNRGIEASKGKYILPLDADNRLYPDYPLRAITYMEEYPEVDIVYGQGKYFGDQQGIKSQPPFHLQALMVDNFIDVCAVFRRTVWEGTEGYDPQMKTGLEDWEFWLHAAFKGFRFQQIPDLGFDYRVSRQSRNARFMADKRHINEIMDYLIQKHPEHYGPQHLDRLFYQRLKKNPIGFLVKILLKQYSPRYFDRLVREGKMRKYLF